MKTYDGDLDPKQATSDGEGPMPSNADNASGDDQYGIVWTLVGLLLIPFILLYNVTRYLLSVILGVLMRPVPLVLFVVGITLVAHLLGVIDLPVDAALSGAGGVLSAAGNTSNSTATPQDASSQSGDIDRAEIETLVHKEINEERSARDLGGLKWDGELREIARYHSQQMAINDFFAHTSPQGQTMGDRYDKFGYTCRVATSGNRYLTGAENIAQTYHHKNVIGQGRLTTNQEVAEALVQQWMDSEGHRENILTADWNNEGVGVYITRENEVYATQNFC